MSSRHNILQRLRKAQPAKTFLRAPDHRDAALYRDYPEADNDLAACFGKQLEALSGEFYRVPDEKAAADQLLQLRASTEKGGIMAHGDPLIESVFSHLNGLADLTREPDATDISSEEFARFQIGVTAADFLAARTGSIFLRTHTAGGRRLSALPPFHIVLAKSSQIVPSIDAVFPRLEKQEGEWSYGVFITGPSRTADIEKILVLGAHGPKRLAVILIDD